MIAGLTAGSRPAHVARRARAIAWRVADVLAAMAEHGPIDVNFAWTAGSRATTLLLSSRPTPRACRSSAAPSTPPQRAPPRSRRWAAKVWESISEIAERVPTGERVEPQRDAAWRAEQHEAWRTFVERAAALEVNPSRAPAYENMLAP